MSIFGNFGTFTALILTLAVFSGFFKQNPLCRFAESLFIGVSAGYFAVIWYFSIIKPTYQSALHGDLLVLIPLIAGLLLFIPSNSARLYSKFRFLPAAFIVIVTLAVNIPIYFNAFLKEMIRTSIIPLVSFDSDGNFQLDATINALLSILAVTSTMMFLVARYRSGTFIRRTGEIGRFYILIAIGAAFAYTLLSRLILFMGKIEFIINAAKIRF